MNPDHTLLSLSLVSKNNKRTGVYLYVGVCVDHEGNYRYVSFPPFRAPQTVSSAATASYTVGRVISPEFYKQNGILA